MTKRIALGALNGGSFGLRVSQPGYDVTTLNPQNVVSDNQNLIFNSDWASVLPLVASGSVALGAGASETVSYDDLGFTPFANIMFSGASYFESGNWFPGTYPKFYSWGEGGASAYQVSAFASATGLALSNGTSGTITIGYAIYNVQAF